MKNITPPRLSTAFSESGKSAKRRIGEILNTKTKRLGAGLAALAVFAAVCAGACLMFGQRTPRRTPEAEVSLAERLYATKHPYVGDASANGMTASALGISASLGGFTNELFTDAEPYGWRLNFENAPNSKYDKMSAYAAALLALVDNLGYVEWSYPGYEAVPCLTAEGASEMLGRDIKSAADSEETLASLLEDLGLFDYHNELYEALTGVSLEEFAENALIIRDNAPENIGKLRELLNVLAFDEPAALKVVRYIDGEPTALCLRSDGDRFWGAEYDGYVSSGKTGDGYFDFGPYNHLKIMREGSEVYFYLVNDPDLTLDDIFKDLVSSATAPYPPEFRPLFNLDEAYYHGDDAIY